MSGVRQPGCVTPRLLSPGSKCRSYQNTQDCGLCMAVQLQSKAWDIWILLVYRVSDKAEEKTTDKCSFFLCILEHCTEMPDEDIAKSLIACLTCLAQHK